MSDQCAESLQVADAVDDNNAAQPPARSTPSSATNGNGDPQQHDTSSDVVAADADASDNKDAVLSRTSPTPPSPSRNNATLSASPPSRFICGVIEGFYGRPWTTEQRKDLFAKLRRWNMDSFVYAPKDDYKHRAYWRELYTREEGDHLAGLIAAAKAHGIAFYYALSPGLDMTYSSAKELSTLKSKLDQVSQLGCEAFALLFDDIDAEMCAADREAFRTFAAAQVSVTNEIHQHLNGPRFLFCPTQYCASRAVPTVVESEYLRTLGDRLDSDIDILWTGSKVISKELTLDELTELTAVLRRRPVIWDNLHANDYDQKRVFLGPYKGRSPQLMRMLGGVLTNPNCEFHANALAVHTLAQWQRCRRGDGDAGDVAGDQSESYDPCGALQRAIADWLPEFSVSKEAYGPITKPHPAAAAIVMPVLPIIPSLNTCMSLPTSTKTTTTTTEANGGQSNADVNSSSTATAAQTMTTMSTSTSTSTSASALTTAVAEVNTSQLQALADVCSVVTGADSMTVPSVMMNSLVSATSIVTNVNVPDHPEAVCAVELRLPTVPVPVSSVGLPIANFAGTDYQLGGSVAAANGSGESPDVDRSDETMADDADVDGERNGKQRHGIDDDAMAEDGPAIAEDVDEPMDGTNVSNGDKVVAGAATIVDDVVMMESTSASLASSDGSTSSMQVSNYCSFFFKRVHLYQWILNTRTNQVECSDVSLQSGDMPIESQTAARAAAAAPAAVPTVHKSIDKLPITADDILLMCDLFYLPFEHGARALRLLNEFNWLKTNAVVLKSLTSISTTNGHKTAGEPPTSDDAREWLERADRFHALGHSVMVLAKRLARCANRELVYELFAYVWDIAGVITLLMGFVEWLALGSFPPNINTYTQGSYTWFSKGEFIGNSLLLFGRGLLK